MPRSKLNLFAPAKPSKDRPRALLNGSEIPGCHVFRFKERLHETYADGAGPQDVLEVIDRNPRRGIDLEIGHGTQDGGDVLGDVLRGRE